jgi:hypothetical protein
MHNSDKQPDWLHYIYDKLRIYQNINLKNILIKSIRMKYY